MAHSSFIDCEAATSLSGNFISEADLKVEIETQQVNDDENVAVEVLGQLSGNIENGSDEITALVPIKMEEVNDGYATYVHEVRVENVLSEEGNINEVNALGIHHMNVDHFISIESRGDNMSDKPGNEKNITVPEPAFVNRCASNDFINSGVNNNNISSNFICSFCGLKEKTDLDLQNHIMISHSSTEESTRQVQARPYKCQNCHMAFQRKSSLKNHSKIHMYGTPMSNSKLIIPVNAIKEELDNDNSMIFHDDDSVDIIDNIENISMTLKQKHTKRNNKKNSNRKKVLPVNNFSDGKMEVKEEPNVDNVVQNDSNSRIPPFETLRPNNNLNTSNTNFTSLDNNVTNLFDSWNDLNDTEQRNQRGANTTDNPPMDNFHHIDIKPLIDINCINGTVDFNSPSAVNHSSERQQRSPPSSSVYTSSSNTYLDLQQQNLIESKEKPYVCPFCNRNFAREKALYNHIRIHNDNYDVTLECQKCHDVFDDIISLQAHLVACVLPEASVAGSNYDNQSSESNDYNTSGVHHRNYDNHNISNCSSRRFFNPNIHINDSMSSGDHVCNICSKRFKTRQKVFRHMWVHRKKVFRCEVCSLQFPSVNHLDEHRLALHPSSGPFVCDTCGKSFMSKQGLTEHSRLHRGWSDQYYCTYCQKYFSSRQGFTIHGRIHTDERPYGCKYCTKCFRDGGTLKKHERIHTGERPHECPLCHKRYNQKVVLREHIRGVHVMKKNSDINKCPVCHLGSMDKEELSEHIVRHSDELMKKSKQQKTQRYNGINDNKLNNNNNISSTSRKKRIKTGNKDIDEEEETNLKSDDEIIINQFCADSLMFPFKTLQNAQRKRNKLSSRNKKERVVKNNTNQLKSKKILNKYGIQPQKKINSNKKLSNKKKSVKNRNDSFKNIDDDADNDRFIESQMTDAVGQELANKSQVSTNVDNHFSLNFNEYNSNSCSNSNKCLTTDLDETNLNCQTTDTMSSKLLECEMCHAKFPSRSELITHVFVHI